MVLTVIAIVSAWFRGRYSLYKLVYRVGLCRLCFARADTGQGIVPSHYDVSNL